jgi:hypothetical protein
MRYFNVEKIAVEHEQDCKTPQVQRGTEVAPSVGTASDVQGQIPVGRFVLGGQTNTSNGLAPVPTRGCERRRVARLYGIVRIHVEKLGTRLG